MRSIAMIAAAMAVAAMATGCAIVPAKPGSPGMGALLGAGAGAVIGHQYGNGGRDKGALIGGALGYTAGLFYEQREREMNSGPPDGYYRQREPRGQRPGNYYPAGDGGYYYVPPQEGYYYRAPGR